MCVGEIERAKNVEESDARIGGVVVPFRWCGVWSGGKGDGDILP